LCRCCVPVFLMASAYLQFPLHYSNVEFFKRRAVRILIPMLVWTLVYAFVWGEPVQNLKGLLFNFNYAAGHLWFVYMLLGIYLIMPLLSPWAEKVSKQELSIYLGIWLFTLLIPYVREWGGGIPPIIQAADGLPAQALFPLWGEASWNPFGTFYYISGFVGYMLWGLYIRRFIPNTRQKATQGLILFLLGFTMIVFGLLRRFSETGESFPLAGDLAVAVAWEVPITFCSLFVLCTALGLVLMFRRVFRSERSGPFYRHLILPLSQAGYGMYLIHMLVLAYVSGWFRSWLGLGADGVLGVWTTPVQILGTALCSFVVVGLVAVLVQRIPRVGKYLMG
ncbi:MAG: acyltransferase family protein, partial [Bacteroidales bacterium]|nr:acyltransferase family protein [Bacteroidales bacterium]